MRHAKSSWKSGAATDHARPLNKRGRRDAPRVAERLVQLSWTPQLVLCSNSKRTTETYVRMSEVFPETVRIEYLPSLYAAGIDEAREELGRLPADIGRVMLLGHNPGWEEVIEYLSGESVALKTACAVLMTCSADDWAESVADGGKWELEDVIRPKSL